MPSFRRVRARIVSIFSSIQRRFRRSENLLSDRKSPVTDRSPIADYDGVVSKAEFSAATIPSPTKTNQSLAGVDTQSYNVRTLTAFWNDKIAANNKPSTQTAAEPKAEIGNVKAKMEAYLNAAQEERCPEKIVAEKGVCSVKARVYCYTYLTNKIKPISTKVRFSNEVVIIYDYEYF